ncbi:synthase [Seminavis robusta]|uniref:tRNA-dihydrouridine(47) synthase [NAD(P)(+)] n=1 Tax=Seminavis robusta TaxID=568900 RepID=A0A9N8EMX8_9STRA|nr:synthase [Seminavis robusta]|eukprot:Sro1256_g256610.1 synthase (614) ;mRNA; f:9580-11421
MVGASELPFRLLTRKYGAQLAYTPMMSSVRFVREPSYRNEIFQTNPLDRPLVCHFSANSPTDFAKAVQLVADQCDAIDLNLGCPQRTAFVGHFGSYLLDPGPDRQLICDIVRAGVQAVSPSKPILVKIRLLETLDETIQLCRQLKDAGASLIAIHARKRAGWERKGPGARDGPAKLDLVTHIKQAVPNIPIIANGNVISYQDVLDNQTLTNADGIMSAEGILDNPALFLPRLGNNETTIQQTVTIVDPLLHCCFKDDATIPPLDESNNTKDTTNLNSKSATTTSNTDVIKKKKRKLLKKLREIERIQTKVQENGGDDSILEKDEHQKLKAKSSVQEAIRKLDQQEEEQPKQENGTTTSSSSSSDVNQKPTSTTPPHNNNTKELTVANSTHTIPLSQLYDTANDKIALAKEYLQLAQRFGPTTMRTQIFHVRRMMKEILDQYQLMPDCLQCRTPAQLVNIVRLCESYRHDPTLFVYNRQKAKEQALALERKRHEEGKRKAFEARMIRKAKREGKLQDLEYYLRRGATVPTQALVKQLRSMKDDNKPEQLKAWTENDHSQHCLAFHLDKTCQRGRACAFLHVDAKASNGGSHKNGEHGGGGGQDTTFEEQDEVAG